MCKCTGNTSPDIVNQLSNDSKLVNELKNIHQAEYTDDMLQDMWLYLLDRVKPEKLTHLCEKDQMKYFLLSIIKTQVNSRSSKTAVNYRNQFNYQPNSNTYYTKEVIKTIMGYEDDRKIDLEAFNIKVAKELSKIGWYDREIFIRVVNSGKTYAQLAQEIRIADYNIANSFRKTRKLLQKKMKKWNEWDL